MKKVLLVVSVMLVIVGCQSKEKKMVEKEKEDFELLYYYEEDKIRPIVEEEKTVEELVEEIVLEELGFTSDNTQYKEKGVLRGQGIFIESAIRDGSRVPNVSAVPYTERNERDRTKEMTEKEQRQEFARIMLQREEVLERQYATDGDEKERLIMELEKRLVEQGGYKDENGNWQFGEEDLGEDIEYYKGEQEEKRKKESDELKIKEIEKKEREYERREREIERLKKDKE